MIRLVLIILLFAHFFLSCIFFETDFKSKLQNREYTSVVEIFPADFIIDQSVFSDINTEIRIKFSREINPASLDSSTFTVVMLKKFDPTNSDYIALNSISAIKESNDYNLIDDEIQRINDDAERELPLLIDSKIDGNSSLASNNREIFFVPDEPLLNNRIFLILSQKLFDEEFYPVYPHISAFHTLPDYNNDTTEADAENKNSEEPLLDLPKIGELVINEILYDPPDDSLGDSNQDGVRDSYDDEFIEIINVSGRDISLDGVSISVGDVGKIKNSFGSLEIMKSGGVIVLFGGGQPSNFHQNCTVMVSQNSLKLSNSGSSIHIVRGDEIIDSISYKKGDGDNQSISRYPDLTGDFIAHGGVQEGTESFFSPCRRVDGDEF